MRLSAAIVLLLTEQTFQVSAIRERTEPSSLAGLRKKLRNEKRLHAQASKNSNDHDAFNKLIEPSAGILVNAKSDESIFVPKECNPKSDDPDVGILSCGRDGLCIEIDGSGLGGICIDSIDSYRPLIPRRRFLHLNGADISSTYQYYHNASKVISPDYFCYTGTFCDCSGIDNVTKKGSLSCDSGFYCFKPENTTCFSTSRLSATFRENGSYYFQQCYSFVSPESLELCYFFNSTVSGGLTSCTVDNVTCNACNSGYGNVTCLYFDCSNTAAKSRGGGISNKGKCINAYIFPPSPTQSVTNTTASSEHIKHSKAPSNGRNSEPPTLAPVVLASIPGSITSALVAPSSAMLNSTASNSTTATNTTNSTMHQVPATPAPTHMRTPPASGPMGQPTSTVTSSMGTTSAGYRWGKNRFMAIIASAITYCVFR